MDIKNLFDKPKIIGLVANTDEGKSNTIYWLLDSLNKDMKFKTYAYGLRSKYAGINKIHSVSELESITDSLIVIDEMFSLFDLDNRKIKGQIENTIRLLFHNNNILLLCGLGENFKKFLSAKIHVVIFKKITLSDLINGSGIKNIVMNYQGVEKGSTMLNLKIDEALIYDGKHYQKFKIPYMKQYDSKVGNKAIFIPKKSIETKFQQPNNKPIFIKKNKSINKSSSK